MTEQVRELVAEDPADEKRADAERTSEERADAHLADIDDGSGCTEIWEHLSERRDSDEE